MTDIFIERAVAIFGMMFWLAFPIGLMISIITQHRHSHSPSLMTGANNQAMGFAYYENADEQQPNSEKEEKQNENDSEEENGALHYLKGREKLHREDNHPTSN